MLRLKLVIVVSALALLAACNLPTTSRRLLSSPAGILYKNWDSVYITSLKLNAKRDSFIIITAVGSTIRKPANEVWGVCYDGNTDASSYSTVYRIYNGKQYRVSDPDNFGNGICIYRNGSGGRHSSNYIYLSLTSNTPVYKFNRKNVRRLCASDPCLKNKLKNHYSDFYWLPNIDAFKKMYEECHP